MQPGNLLPITTLGDRWVDNDLMMLHACFQLLTNCIEQEHLFTATEWEENEAKQHARQELEALHQWWQERSEVERQRQLDPIWTKNQYEKDNQMLIRLIKVRQYLWT
ncbi:hypothetical protein [Hymenobacter jejuensis]|uniref:Uncharacterized protein n=1 Tax=Hymenobacter jejuensis TaxID=2502781 RepID=A0A5B8A5N4_9BACT|nr:hypothetical protein [Hymenobacter jejuensis]QDA61925.1 hypothetical protein FHG12_18285 [Hymenobacter jejuensis]